MKRAKWERLGKDVSLDSPDACHIDTLHTEKEMSRLILTVAWHEVEQKQELQLWVYGRGK